MSKHFLPKRKEEQKQNKTKQNEKKRTINSCTGFDTKMNSLDNRRLVLWTIRSHHSRARFEFEQ